MTCPHLPFPRRGLAAAPLLAFALAACAPPVDEPLDPPPAGDGKFDHPDVSLCPERAREVAFLGLRGQVLDFEVEDGLGVLAREDDDGVCLYDLRDPRRPHELACVHPPGEASGVDIEDGLLYAAVRDQGLWIYDVSTPHAPVLLSTTVTSSKSWDVTVVDGLAYLADGHAGVRILDVFDPLEPIQRGSVAIERLTFPAFTSDVAVRGSVAYVAAGTAGLATVDVADPDAPHLLANVTLGISGKPDEVAAISLSGSRAYAAVENGWALSSFDIFDPESPELIASSRGARWGLDVVGIGDIAAITCENDDLCLYRGDALSSTVRRVRARGEIIGLGYEAGHVFYASEEGWMSDRTGIGAVRIACN